MIATPHAVVVVVQQYVVFLLQNVLSVPSMPPSPTGPAHVAFGSVDDETYKFKIGTIYSS